MQLYFQCNCGGCIPVSRICDGKNDCKDVSDEKTILCTIKSHDGVNAVQWRYMNSIGHCGLTQLHNSVIYPFDICDNKGKCTHCEDEWTFNCSQTLFHNVLRCGSPIRYADICTFKTLSRIPCPTLDRFVITSRIQQNRFGQYTVKQSSIIRNPFHQKTHSCKVSGLSLTCINLKSSLRVKSHIRTLEIQQTIFFNGTKLVLEKPHFLQLLIISDSVLTDPSVISLQNYQAMGILVLQNSSLFTIDTDFFKELSDLVYLCLKQNPLHKLLNYTLSSQKKSQPAISST